MKVTKQHVDNLLKLISGGIINGAGSTEHLTEFCIQQAVHRVIDGELDEYRNDHAPEFCIHECINALGICLNDSGYWDSDLDRAKGLKRFAIAELGSAEMDWHEFTTRLELQIRNLQRPGTQAFMMTLEDNAWVGEFMQLRPEGMREQTWITMLADMCANTMRDLKTEGSEFLWIVDEPDKEKRRKAARKLGWHKYQQSEASRRCSFGSNCSFGLPAKGHHFHKPLPVTKPKQ